MTTGVGWMNPPPGTVSYEYVGTGGAGAGAGAGAVGRGAGAGDVVPLLAPRPEDVGGGAVGGAVGGSGR